jgi:hypothetical protein
MMTTIAHWTLAAWCSGRRSQSLPVRWHRLIQENVLSTSQRRGSTVNPIWPASLLTTCTASPSTVPKSTGQQPAKRPQRKPPALAVLHTGAGDRHDQQQPTGVHRDVPVANVDLLPTIKPATGAGDGLGSADGPGAKDGPRREVDRQRSPYATVVVHMADRVHDVTARVADRAHSASVVSDG